uniref:BAH and coiled-coil domain-containing protein 1 n=2 Tax=Anthurium amnicola TaxID=1678845 RepID=A0A1D1ZK63_9ARAE
MSQPEEAVQFTWGEKKGRGKDKNVHFYGSFVYDGVDYSLYDCVYLYQQDEPEPYIGKIVKIWEQPVQKKRVKILWFFRPIEVRNFLRGYEEPLKNEIFLASGEGVGVVDVNPLEAISGKCNVICTLKDERNTQPSDEELKMADYIFYRTFDVGNYTISDKIGDSVAGVEAKHIFNWEEVVNNSVGDGRSDKNGASKKSPHTVSPGPEATGGKTMPRSEPALATPSRAGPPDAFDDKPSKKIKLVDSPKPAEYLLKSGSSVRKHGVSSDGIDKKISVEVARLSEDKAKSKNNADLVGPDEGFAKKRKLDTVTNRSSDKSIKIESPVLPMDERQTTNETVVVPRRTEVDTSKWFTLRWEDKILKAHEQGTLVLLENFPWAYTSEEIEDLIYHFFKKKCNARVIESCTFSNPHHGQALIICKTRADADEIVKELKERVLMLTHRRPLVGRRAIPRPSAKSSKFFGHYYIDRLKMQREEWKKAVSTSHCSQANTIEFEMGMDWVLLQEQSKSWWSELHKGHEEEMKQAAQKPKS